jgi:DNA-binding GntR family transcriptional regulator
MPQYLYERVTDEIRRRIASGEYPPGSQLPSRRELSGELSASDPVIGVAMRALKAEGLVVTLNGVGAFVAEAVEGQPPE